APNTGRDGLRSAEKDRTVANAYAPPSVMVWWHPSALAISHTHSLAFAVTTLDTTVLLMGKYRLATDPYMVLMVNLSMASSPDSFCCLHFLRAARMRPMK